MTLPEALDRREVERAAAPLGEARMLPRAAYVDPSVLAWEREHLFSGWRCAGRVADLAPEGSRAHDLGAGGVLLVRDREGVLRAFDNACRHRGHELLPCGGSATGRAITCPYHSWSYRLDGSLLAAPGYPADLDTASLGLRPVRVHEWAGWAFVDASGEAPAFADHLGALASMVEPYEPASLVEATVHDYEVAANWKVVVENYQECYHCSTIHPELCAVSPPDSGDNYDLPGDWIGGSMDLRPGVETMSLDGRSGGTAMTRLDERSRRTVLYVAVLPDLLLSLHPDYVMAHHLTPLAADRTRIRCSWSFPRSAIEAPGFDPAYAVDFWDLTNRQDWAACESVQRGVTTAGWVPGPLAPAEDGLHQFTSWVARAYLR